MIDSVDEFIRLRTSEVVEEYTRAAHDEAPLHVWEALIRDHHEMKVWVAHNKTVPLAILETLSTEGQGTAGGGSVTTPRRCTST